MNAKILTIVSGVVVVVAAGALIIINADDGGQTEFGGSGDVRTGEQADAGATKTACDIFTDDIAVQVLGAGATKSDLPSATASSTDDVSVSNCLYEIEVGDALETANVLVRGGKTATGRSSNDFGFHNLTDIDGNPLSTEGITGIGDEAYWSPDFGQVHVYLDDGEYWLIAQYGSQGTAAQRAKAEQLAQLVVANL